MNLSSEDIKFIVLCLCLTTAFMATLYNLRCAATDIAHKLLDDRQTRLRLNDLNSYLTDELRRYARSENKAS